ncbi:hypothetical protein D6833_03620 [Candidatus Parcubacteria bacterium]|nr:MAG: hypothetical protein D6833_03620 [Candidatus Parcubacteria bacterium]
MKKGVLYVLIVLLVIAMGGLVLANTQYDLSWHVIGGGGGTSSGGHYALDATIGQPVAASSGGDVYQVCAGYWCGNVPGWHLYLPNVEKSAD